MDTSRKICTILTAEDLSAEKISETAKIIEQTPDKIYLLSPDLRLCNVIDRLSKVIGKKSTLTRIRMAYNLQFDLKTILKTDGKEIGNVNDLLKPLENALTDLKTTLKADGKEIKTIADLLNPLENALTNLKTTLKADSKGVKTFADLLELLDFDENLGLKRTDYHVIIDDENLSDKDIANRAVAKLFQQTIFLNIGLDIQKKSEIKMAMMKDRFRANYSALVGQIKQQKNFLAAALEHAALNDSGRKRVKDMLDALNKTDAELEKARARPLRIAAMGTKKAGKSVVINDLLRCDFAPTSSELPTPNTIKYIPAEPNSRLILDYAGRKYTFFNAESLKKFIGDKFIKAQEQTGKGAALPDMTIYYPCDDLNGYEIWDTPGPNYAGAGDEHRKNAEACIREVDVCIFVMDYAKYLTDDEEKFLKDIRAAFQRNDKFYSLFITVNKIDQIYTAEVQKSVNRVLDYIGGKLDELGYKNIVVFGTSALQSFYLDKVIELAKKAGKCVEPFIDSDVIRLLSKDYRVADDYHKSSIMFTKNAIDNLDDFHNIPYATEKEIETFSGIPQLRRYVKYIGESKADMEIVNKVIGDCEAQFAIIRNALDVSDYQLLGIRQRFQSLFEIFERIFYNR